MPKKNIPSELAPTASITIFPNKPLFIGCSGGGGHIAAIESIISDLQAKHLVDPVEPIYVPQAFKDKNSHDATRRQIKLGASLMHKIPFLASLLKRTSIPVLPKKEILDKEIEILSQKNVYKRKYIDMLLDVFPAGYESVAIWNILQKSDKTEELKKLIDMQAQADKFNYKTVKCHYLNILLEAEKKGEPYTQLISTQAMALPALCDAVIEYNADLKRRAAAAPPIMISQYMTDLPTTGAVHFFQSLSHLNRQQRQQMYLYGVNFENRLKSHYKLNKPEFAGLFNVDPFNNPMVRPGFKDPALANLPRAVTLAADETTETYSVSETDRVASVILGSQAGDDTVDYVMKFAQHGYDKIFVFGGKNEHIATRLQAFTDEHPEYKDKIVLLANQGDLRMAPIMVRSDVVVQRGGGMCVMERLALPRRSDQTILVHCKEGPKKVLTSGISWEDKNVDEMFKHLEKSGVQCARTTLNCFDQQLDEIAAGTFAQRAQDVRAQTEQIFHEDIKLMIQQIDRTYPFIDHVQAPVTVSRCGLFSCKGTDYRPIQQLKQTLQALLALPEHDNTQLIIHYTIALLEANAAHFPRSKVRNAVDMKLKFLKTNYNDEYETGLITREAEGLNRRSGMCAA